MTGPRRLLAILAMALCTVALATAVALAVYPSSIGATGDSITQAFNSCGMALRDCPENSWSTGTFSTVRSMYLRIRERNREIEGHLSNQSATGARAAELETQMTILGRLQPNFVTVEIGANDACTPTVETMTTTAAFEASVDGSLRYITERVVGVRVLVASIPNVYNLWNLLKSRVEARTAWSTYMLCQSLLANPLSEAEADVRRRLRVREQIVAYNEALRRACSLYRGCQYDNRRVFEFSFEAMEISTIDYFHPSVRGQATLARVEWEITLF